MHFASALNASAATNLIRKEIRIEGAAARAEVATTVPVNQNTSKSVLWNHHDQLVAKQNDKFLNDEKL